MTALTLTSANISFRPVAGVKVAPLQREFRGAWIATVNNIDWPSHPNLTTSQQQKELRTLIGRAAALRLNCVIFQVRPACDAFYVSKLEPWSEYLTGKMGRAPKPAWDPLAFAIGEAHRQGMELHAWFNPYRARYKGAKSAVATNHISLTQPALVKAYNGFQWLDPAEAAARAHSLRVILDVVQRYDVDGIHIDDYFYPYPDKKHTAFPDDASWKKYRGNMVRNDWRRMHINNFIRQINTEVHRVKPWVKFGVSPFGIWRPGHPKQIKGLDAYDELYADARLWLREGWLDYCAPQLYWQIADTEQAYPVLMQWWHEQNPKRRHLWPGINTAKVKTWKAKEFLSQINLTRRHPGVTGNIHWNISALAKNDGDLGAMLQRGIYSQPALPPASPWLDTSAQSAFGGVQVGCHSPPNHPHLARGTGRTHPPLAISNPCERPMAFTSPARQSTGRSGPRRHRPPRLHFPHRHRPRRQRKPAHGAGATLITFPSALPSQIAIEHGGRGCCCLGRCSLPSVPSSRLLSISVALNLNYPRRRSRRAKTHLLL